MIVLLLIWVANGEGSTVHGFRCGPAVDGGVMCGTVDLDVISRARCVLRTADMVGSRGAKKGGEGSERCVECTLGGW